MDFFLKEVRGRFNFKGQAQDSSRRDGSAKNQTSVNGDNESNNDNGLNNSNTSSVETQREEVNGTDASKAASKATSTEGKATSAVDVEHDVEHASTEKKKLLAYNKNFKITESTAAADASNDPSTLVVRHHQKVSSSKKDGDGAAFVSPQTCAAMARASHKKPSSSTTKPSSATRSPNPFLTNFDKEEEEEEATVVKIVSPTVAKMPATDSNSNVDPNGHCLAPRGSTYLRGTPGAL